MPNPLLNALRREGGHRQQDQQAEVGDGQAGPASRPTDRPIRRSDLRAPTRGVTAAGAWGIPQRQLLEVETPSPCSILATTPVAGVKKTVLTLVHPPRLAIVKSILGFGKLNWAATDASTGR